MGNRVCKDVLENEDKREYLFAGRQNEINEIKEMLKTKDIIQVYGMTKIGKSRILVRLLNEFHATTRTCFFHDFRYGVIRSDDDLKKKLNKALADEAFSSRKDLPHETESIDIFIETLLDDLQGIEGDPCLLFLDNVNKLFSCESTKDLFLSFLKNVSSLKDCKLKICFTTTEKIGLNSQQFGQVEIGRMDDEHIGDIIRTIVQKNGISQDDFNFGEVILGEKNLIYMDIIVKECEGLPLAAHMVAMELIADDGMLCPADVVQLLFNQRVRSLSMEYYPPDDRLDCLKKDIEHVRHLDMYFFQTLNRNLDAENRQHIERLRIELTRDNDKSKVDISKSFKLLTQPCIIKFLGKTREIGMHSIFRECIFEMTGTNNIDDQVFKNLLVENARRYGMDLSDNELENPQLLDKFVHRLNERNPSNQNENRYACAGSCTNVEPSACSDIEQVVVEEDKESNISDVSDNLHAQTSDADRLCTLCNRVIQPGERCDPDPGSKQGVPHYNIPPCNINFCSCPPKMRELKCVNSVEDNETVDKSEITFTTNPDEPQKRETGVSCTMVKSMDSSATLLSSSSNHNALPYSVNRNVTGHTTTSETAPSISQQAMDNDVNYSIISAASNLSIKEANAITSSEGRTASVSGQGAMSFSVNNVEDRSKSDITNDINRVGQLNSVQSCLSNDAGEPSNIFEDD